VINLNLRIQYPLKSSGDVQAGPRDGTSLTEGGGGNVVVVVVVVVVGGAESLSPQHNNGFRPILRFPQLL
jgi:hypothetical protein